MTTIDTRAAGWLERARATNCPAVVMVNVADRPALQYSLDRATPAAAELHDEVLADPALLRAVCRRLLVEAMAMLDEQEGRASA